MVSRSVAVGVLAAGLIVGAGGGAYLAVRQQASPTQPVAVTQPAPVEQAVAGAQPVAETEAVVAPLAPLPEKTAASPEKATADGRDTKTANVPGKKSSVPQATRRAVESARSEASDPRPPVATSPTRNEDGRESRPRVADSRPPVAPPSTATSRPANAPARDTWPEAASARDVDPPASAARPAPAVVPVETPPAPPVPQYAELVVPASSVIGLRVETAVTTEHAQLEDRVEARVTRDVMTDGRVAIPAGARAIGSVMLVERGGKMKDRARLGVRFHTLVLDDGTELPVNTEAIYREGESPTGESARKIGGAAVGGAILGALIGGKKGAIVGGAAGAAGGSAVVMGGDRNAATLPSGTVVTIRLAAPVGVEVEKR